MADDDEPSSGERGPQPRPSEGVALRIPLWAIVATAFGWMLAVRLETTTDYVAHGRLELMAFLCGTALGVVFGARAVTRAASASQGDAPRGRAGFGFLLVFMILQSTSPPAVYGVLSLVNRLGRTDDVVWVKCMAGRLESRASLSGGRKAEVRYACVMPDGQKLSSHAEEDLPAEEGKPLIIPSARGRLGAWIRTGPPEPVADPSPDPAPATSASARSASAASASAASASASASASP